VNGRNNKQTSGKNGCLNDGSGELPPGRGFYGINALHPAESPEDFKPTFFTAEKARVWRKESGKRMQGTIQRTMYGE